MNSTITIPKESIVNFRFDTNDVMPTEAAKGRLRKLFRAMKLGNAYHGKVKIMFKTKSHGIKTVETTIWALGDKFITLKAGVCIPIAAILDIEF